MRLLKTILKPTLFICSIFMSVATLAQAPAIDENSQAVRVKYLEADNDEMRFNLKYDNNTGDNFKVMVISETGDILFQNVFSGKNFKKHVKLPRLTDSDGVTFLIRPVKGNVQLSYKVYVPNKVVDTPLVANN